MKPFCLSMLRPRHSCPSLISWNRAFRRGIYLNIIESVRPRTGANLPNMNISFSAVMITLKHENQITMAANMTDIEMP